MLALLPFFLHLLAAIIWTLVCVSTGESLVTHLAADLPSLTSNRKTADSFTLVAGRSRPSSWRGDQAGRRSGDPAPINCCRGR